MKNDCYLVLMYSIRKVLVITITTVTSNFSLNPKAINFFVLLRITFIKKDNQRIFNEASIPVALVIIFLIVLLCQFFSITWHPASKAETAKWKKYIFNVTFVSRPQITILEYNL